MKPIVATIFSESRRDFFWLDGGFGMLASSPARGLGFNLRFGGIFTSVPAVVASMGRQPIVISQGARTTDVIESQQEQEASEPAERGLPGGGAGGPIGGPIGGTGGGALLTPRLDLFGLGLDYALYHKRFWGVFDQDETGPWQRLGGVFTSAPAAIAWGNGRVDVFGVGLDHAMYVRTSVDAKWGEKWTPDWFRLGGAFTSAATLISRGPASLDVFARGADFTLRANHTDGATWFGWQNLGGNLASPPVAVSWGPNRMDIFAIFKDGALWHRWWDGQIWNDWESLGGNYVGEPAVASWGPGRLDVFVVDVKTRGMRHHWFSGDTWSVPEALSIGSNQGLAESPAVISTKPNCLEVFVPAMNNQIRIVKWDGQAWSAGSAGAGFRAPQRYRMSVDFVKVKTTRALNADNDGAMLSVAAGNATPQIKTQWIGEIGGLSSPKESQTNLLRVDPVTVDLAEPMSLSYLVVNNGHAPQDKILKALANAGDSLSLSGSSSMSEDIAKGVIKILSVKLLDAISLSVPVVGSIVGQIESWLLGKLTDAVFESCDGVVAVELRAMLGRDLYLMTDNGRKTVTLTTAHAGTDSPTACGAKSDYRVTWTIQPL